MKKYLFFTLTCLLIGVTLLGCSTSQIVASSTSTPAPTSTPEPTPTPTGIRITGTITNLADAQQYLNENSYLQLVPLPANGQLGFTTDDQGRLAYDSTLAQIPIPEDGIFTFQVETLEPGSYLIAAQRFLGIPGAMPLLVNGTEFVIVEIPQNAVLPLNFDLGEVAINIP